MCNIWILTQNLATNGTQERSNILQVEMLHDTWTTLHQQIVAFVGCGTMKVLITSLELVEHVLVNNSTQFHVLDALTEEAKQLLTANPPHSTGHHSFDGSLGRLA